MSLGPTLDTGGEGPAPWSRLALLAAFAVVLTLPAQLRAQTTLVAGLDWSELAAQERAELAPIQPRWAELDEGRQRKWRDLARRMPSLPEDERERIRQRMSDWSSLSPQARGEARLRFIEAQRWSSQTRRERWDEYQSLDPKAREVLAERWRLEEAARQAQGNSSHEGKRNLIEPQPESLSPPRPASPTTVRAPAGATSTLLAPESVRRGPLNAGVPKIATTEAFVDPVTLLPRRGPQGAAITRVPRKAAQP